jgi:hypothetical protein
MQLFSFAQCVLMTTQSVTTVVKQFFNAVGTWSLPLKFLASALVGAVAGSSVLGVLVEYATHSYALAYGFRPPVEGTPYLRTIVSATSFSLLISGALLAAVVMWLFSSNRKRLTGSPKSELVFGLVVIAVSLAGLAIPVALDLFTSSSSGSKMATGYFGLMGSLFSLGLSAVFAAQPRLVWWLSLGTVAVYYAGVVCALFVSSNYAAVLRYTGFGGGIPVQVHVDQGGSTPMLEVSGYLMLRTATTLVVFSDKTNRFFEYSMQRVVHVSYAADALDAQRFKMPSIASPKQ